ncbi:MAG: hypothetical protein IJU50_00595 [Lachnospiraceae bacterium]|nr:hypothetical protein [Deltaproteobacteria bacterium]MBQ9436812.1 hypothetical protein [Lachnospiraceae bacterium]
MEISGLTSSVARLWERLENFGLSPGAELRVPAGSTGEPPRELVQEFARAMESQPVVPEGKPIPQEALAGENLSPGVVPEPFAEPVRVSEPSHVAENDDFNWKTMQQQEGGLRPSFQDRITELSQLLEKAGSCHISPVELYRIQYLVGIFKVQATGAVKVSQQVGQGVESLLKQQG